MSKRAKRSRVGVWMSLFVAPWDLNVGRTALGRSDKTTTICCTNVEQNLLTTTEEAPKWRRTHVDPCWRIHIDGADETWSMSCCRGQGWRQDESRGGRSRGVAASPGGNRRSKICPHADPSKPGPSSLLPFTPFSRSFQRLWEGSGASELTGLTPWTECHWPCPHCVVQSREPRYRARCTSCTRRRESARGTTPGYPGRFPEWLTGKAAFQRCLDPLAVGDTALRVWRCRLRGWAVWGPDSDSQGGGGGSPSSAPPSPQLVSSCRDTIGSFRLKFIERDPGSWNQVP